ncbi:MAG: hypothetical protein M3198_06850 [Actinomycetota bacterium]|nr:hypothetical protein [Actinomycetota bacterium]
MIADDQAAAVSFVVRVLCHIEVTPVPAIREWTRSARIVQRPDAAGYQSARGSATLEEVGKIGISYRSQRSEAALNRDRLLRPD